MPRPPPRPDAQLLRRVRALVEDSERKQQNELALRIAELASEWETKRKIDLKNIDWNLQAIQKDTGFRMVAGQKQMRGVHRQHGDDHVTHAAAVTGRENDEMAT